MLCEYGIFLQSILLSNYTVCLGTKTSPIFFTISNLRLDLLYLFNLFSQSLPLLVTCYLSLFRISGLHYSWGWFRFGSFFMDFSLFKKNLFYWFFFYYQSQQKWIIIPGGLSQILTSSPPITQQWVVSCCNSL
jgi:hypothetical protein